MSVTCWAYQIILCRKRYRHTTILFTNKICFKINWGGQNSVLVNNFILKDIPSEMFNFIKEIPDISCGFWPYVRPGAMPLLVQQ